MAKASGGKAKGRMGKSRKVVGDTSPCPACQVIASAASGSLFYAEDTTLVAMTPPTVYSQLVWNPDTGTPQWEAVDGGGGGGEVGSGSWSFSYQVEGWDAGTPSENPTCANPGTPPFPEATVGASASYDGATGQWEYYPPP